MSRAPWNRRTRLAAGALLAVSALLAGPAGARDERILITDPALLESLGFDPYATDVYATIQAYEQLRMDPAERVALQEARLMERHAAHENSPVGGPFGIGTPGFSSIDSHAFNPSRDNTEFARSSGGSPSGGLFCITGPSGFWAQLKDLPHGSRLRWVDFWYYDVSSEDITFTVLRACQPDLAAGAKSITVLGSASSSGALGIGFRSISMGGTPPIVDMQSCTYSVRVQLDDSGGAIFCSEGSDLQVQKARAEWLREVSPAPGTATFGDVPTGHPFFQHIEALAASGITGGCGGGDFCPSSSLTRGQMAVFLATALGLHWGSF